MYYGRKACPVGNRLLHDAEVRRKQELHRDRLRTIRPCVDTKPPATAGHSHMMFNAKKEQMTEERYARIEHENRLLLAKMSDIMSRPSRLTSELAHSDTAAHAHSLNHAARRRELRRITDENLTILARIQAVVPAYDRWKWEDERIEQERLVESISEYKRPAAGAPPPRAGARGYGGSPSRGGAGSSSLVAAGSSVVGGPPPRIPPALPLPAAATASSTSVGTAPPAETAAHHDAPAAATPSPAAAPVAAAPSAAGSVVAAPDAAAPVAAAPLDVAPMEATQHSHVDVPEGQKPHQEASAQPSQQEEEPAAEVVAEEPTA